MPCPRSFPHPLCILSALADSAPTQRFPFGSPRDVECCDFLRPDLFVGGKFLSGPPLDIHCPPQTKVSLVQLWYDTGSSVDSRI